MIQRIQSVWLFLAALLNVGVFYFDLYTTHTQIAGADTVQHMRVNDNYPLVLIAVMIIALPLISILLFKNRKQQKNLTVFSIIASISFISTVLMRVSSFNKSIIGTSSSSYGVGAVLPFFAIILLILAYSGINKDDKLVKSLDRLR
ncbi:MAG: DUF4293 domain-containing protein [Bacteroidota bacterium]